MLKINKYEENDDELIIHYNTSEEFKPLLKNIIGTYFSHSFHNEDEFIIANKDVELKIIKLSVGSFLMEISN